MPLEVVEDRSRALNGLAVPVRRTWGFSLRLRLTQSLLNGNRNGPNIP